MSNRFKNVKIGEALEISGAHDRNEHIERTLDRLKKDRLKQADRECQQLLARAGEEAAELVGMAKQKAEAIIQEAENKHEAVLNQGYQDGEAAGYKKGYEDGRQQAQEETVLLLESARTLLEGAYEAQHRVLKNFRHNAADLVAYITQKVLHRELHESPESILAMIEAAADALNLTGRIKVVVSVDTLRFLKEYSRETASALESLNRFDLEADPMLDLHEIYVLSEEGNFILTPQKQAEELLAPLEKHLELPEVTPEEINAGIGDLPPHPLENQAAAEEPAQDNDPSENPPDAPLSDSSQPGEPDFLDEIQSLTDGDDEPEDL